MDNVVTNHIEKRRTRAGDERAYIVGTRIRVQDIVADHEQHGLSPEEIAREYPHLTLAQVYASLAYYFDHKDEVRQHMKADAAYAQAVETELRKTQNAVSGKDANHGGVWAACDESKPRKSSTTRSPLARG